jgi:hypothetical protein
MNISVTDARDLFTKTLVDVYQERIKPTNFLRSFFKSVTAPTKLISLEVERMGEQVAIDVFRGTEGNRNSFSLGTEKLFLPPMYREFFDATELDLYDRVLGSQGNANLPLFAALMNKVADRVGTLQDKIDRAKELQCSQVLTTGIVTLKNGVNIDYKRKAASLVDLTVGGGGGYFSTNSDVFKQFENACIFLRTIGRCPDAVFTAILGAQALTDLLANTKFTARQNLFNMALDQVIGPVRGTEGATFHGTISAGAYKVQLFAYPQTYDAPVTNTPTYYIDPKQVIVMPATPRLIMAHAAVPQLIDEPGNMPVQGEYVVGEFKDPRLVAHIIDIQSAPLAVPSAVDHLYTMKACA